MVSIESSDNPVPCLKPQPTTHVLPNPWASRWHRPVQIAFVASVLAAAAFAWLKPNSATPIDFLGWLWVPLGALSCLVNLARRLPTQNVVTAGIIIGGIAALIESISVKTQVPFGARYFLNGVSPVSDRFPLWLITLWILLILSSRGVARLICRPYRKTTYYGFWVIGISALLVGLASIPMESFAQYRMHWWMQEHRVTSDEPSRILRANFPWFIPISWALVAVLILGISTPWLLNKHPVSQAPDLHGLLAYSLLQILLSSGMQSIPLLSAIWILTLIALWQAFRGIGNRFSSITHRA